MPTDPADDSIIDVTGLVLKLKEAFHDQLVDFAKADQAHTTPAPNLSNSHPYYDYEPPSLAKFYRQKLSLTPKQVSWLNRFPLPSNTFLDIEAGREATVWLYLGVLPLLELQLKAEGSTLAQTVKTLDSRAKSLRYYASTTWYYTPPKTGADTYLAIFRLCENAVRERFDYKRKIGGLFGGSLAELEPAFRELLGRRVQELLPPLLARVPAPDAETELLLNEQNTSRWKAELEQLLTRLANDLPALLPALAGLVARNVRNPSLGLLHLELARRLAATHREAALGYVLRHLHHAQARFGEAKPLPKALHKQLFPEAGAAERFQKLVNELALYKNLDDALAKVPAVYTAPRKKIELDRAAIHTARSQHAGTVELLNEYLRDDAPATPPPPKPTKPKATKEAKAAKAPKAPRSPRLAKNAAPVAPAAGQFAAGLAFTDAQQALLALFVTRNLALPQPEVEAFAQRHGVLRNQLIDGLNNACYELLDDVLIEENGDEYTIYEGHFQRLTS